MPCKGGDFPRVRDFRPATVVPAGSNRVTDEVTNRLKYLGVKWRCRHLGQHAGQAKLTKYHNRAIAAELVNSGPKKRFDRLDGPRVGSGADPGDGPPDPQQARLRNTAALSPLLFANRLVAF